MSLLFYRQMSLCDGRGPDWLENYKIFYYLTRALSSQLSAQTKQLQIIENCYILVTLEQPVEGLPDIDWKFCCRRETVPLHLGRLQQEVCQIRRAGQTYQNSHRREELHLPRVQQEIHEIRSPEVRPALPHPLCPSYPPTGLASQSDGHTDTDTPTSGCW